VDEAAAITGDSRRVGDHQLGTLAGYLDVSMQTTWVAGVDLVEDHPSASFGQPGVTLDPAAELGFYVAPRVIEDGTPTIHVKLTVEVARHTGGAGRLDIHQGRAVAAIEYSRSLVTRRIAVSDDIGVGLWRDQ